MLSHVVDFIEYWQWKGVLPTQCNTKRAPNLAKFLQNFRFSNETNDNGYICSGIVLSSGANEKRTIKNGGLKGNTFGWWLKNMVVLASVRL